jgi:N-acylneuraminate cytidylyltransferase
MIGDRTVLAIIPARGGSKGVPRKNIKNLAGKPLIAWTIEEAKKSKYIDRLIISSDDLEIIEIARQWGCEAPFVRSMELAQDDTPGIDPIMHAIGKLPHYDYVMVLQPTSPLRTSADIDLCMELCVEKRARACVSVTEPDKSPYWMFTVDADGKMNQLIGTKAVISRRQDLPKVYAVNGALYIAETAHLLKTRTFLDDNATAFVMVQERSLDIDTDYDFWLCDMVLRKRAGEPTTEEA